MDILDGKRLSESKIPGQIERVNALVAKGCRPSLAILTIGDDPASEVYVRNKKRLAERIGIDVYHKRLQADCTQKDVCDTLHVAANRYHGIIVQLPIPSHLNVDEIACQIPLDADVDGFLPGSPYTQCTAKGVIQLLESREPNLSHMDAVVIGRSEKVGLPIALALLKENMTVTICHSQTSSDSLGHALASADVVVSCVGKPKMFHWGATSVNSIIIDVGMNRDENGKLCGDFDLKGINENHFSRRTFTPVPGGVGPMTVSCLMDNVIDAAERRGVL